MQAPQVQPMSASSESAGQIWECTIDGLKTFSDKSCGKRSSLREIGPINTMESTPVYDVVRSYDPVSNYSPDYPYPSAQESDDYGYSAPSGAYVHGIVRPDYRHHRRYPVNATAPPAQHSKSASPRPH
jgi:hypothetical protein